MSITNGLTQTRPIHYFSQSLNTRAAHENCNYTYVFRSLRCLAVNYRKSALVKTHGTYVRPSFSHCSENGEWNESEQVSNVYLFTKVRKAWEGHTVISIPVNVIRYSLIHVP